MPSLQIRDLPEPIYRQLAELAKRQHRSISQQATVLLARALEVSETPRQRRQALLRALANAPLVSDPDLLRPPEQVVREDRDR